MVEGSQNTLAQKMEDKYQDFIYLPHSEDFPDKALYNESDIHSNDMSYFQRGCKKSVDNEEFISDLLDSNMTIKQKAIKYGRDYIRNYRTYERFVRLLRYEEKLQKYIEEGIIIEDKDYYSVFEERIQREIDYETGEVIYHNDQKKAGE